MLSKTFRTTLYAIILSISVLQIAAAIMASILYMPSRDGAKPQVFYASFASFFALMTFIWSIVLLCYNDRPWSVHVLTRARAHLYAVTAFAGLWLVLSILLTQQIPVQCRNDSYSWENYGDWSCATDAASSALGWLLFITSCSGAVIMFLRNGDAGKLDNITKEDPIDPSRKPPVDVSTPGSTFRATIYSFIIVLGIGETGMGIFSGLENRDIYFSVTRQVFYAGFAAAFGLWSFIWASVLLSYNNRALSTSVLTRLRVHFFSALIAAIGWLVLSILMTTELPYQCDFNVPSDGENGMWCGSDGAASGIGWVLFALTSALTIKMGLMAKTGGGFHDNVAAYDKL